MNFKIKHIDNIQGTIEIDWLNGITLIHNIPLYILENPGLSQERIIQELEYMRPPIPEPIEVPETLLNLVEEPEPEPEPSAEEQARWRRDVLLFELDVIVTNPLRWSDLTEVEQQELADYRQALLDVPQQEGFPNEIHWPVNPLEGGVR